VVDAGSILEDPDQLGLAHFIEHMAFNGTEHFARQELTKYLESIGMRFGADINASTGYDETIYTLTVPTDRPEIVDRAFDILEDWAHGLTFDPKEVDRERGVVIEEWRLGRGAGARLSDRQLPILFKGSRYAERQPIGKKEILEAATPDTLRRFYRDWYRPDLMAVVAVGDFDRARVEKLVKEHFGRLAGPAHERPRPVYPVPDNRETLFAIATDPEATDTSVGIYSKHPMPDQGTVGDYRRSQVEGLYHDLLNARLAEIAHGADPPFRWATSETGLFVPSTAVTFEAVGVRQDEVERGLTALLTEIERVRRHGFTATELARAKADVLRGYEQGLAERGKSDSSSYAGEYVRNFLEGEPSPGIAAEVELVRKLLPGVSLAEVDRLAAEWNRHENRVVLLSAPEKERAALPTEARLLAAFQAVAGRDIAPYQDRTVAGPLVPRPPRAGTLAAETKIPELGVTEWRLSNGVRVVMKPTDFKNDEVLLSGYGPGGLSLVPDEKLPSAMFATAVLAAGGAGGFDAVTLGKALAGKAASANSFISQLEEGVEGSASPRDLDTLFQLAYLKITAPRKDEPAFRSILARLRDHVANRLADPGEVFEDRLTATIAQGNPRYLPITPELLAKVDLDTAYEIYRDRFADAGDFTFFLVGNFTPESIRPLVLTWLGGLPSQGRREQWRDLGVRPPDGVVKVDVAKGLEPKAQVQILFHGDAPFSREARHDLAVLSNVLEVRLREVLRESLGAVYDVEVSADLVKRPRERYQVAVGFGCAPEKADALVHAVFAEIESIQKEGIAETYLKQVKETERRERELALKDNGFWLSALAASYEDGLDPRDILRYDELIGSATSERVRAAARRYLDETRYVLGVLRPEAAAQPAAKTGAAPGR
jgi:zinc protease